MSVYVWSDPQYFFNEHQNNGCRDTDCQLVLSNLRLHQVANGIARSASSFLSNFPGEFIHTASPSSHSES